MKCKYKKKLNGQNTIDNLVFLGIIKVGHQNSQGQRIILYLHSFSTNDTLDGFFQYLKGKELLSRLKAQRQRSEQ